MNKTVLYADDELAMRSVVESLFASIPGVDLITFEDGADLVSFIEQNPQHAISLVITDMQMRQTGGMKVAQALRGKGMNVPILFLSGTFNDTTISRLAEFSNSAWLAKPFSADEFRSVVQKLLA